MGHIWVAIGEKNNLNNVKIIFSDCDFFLGLSLGMAMVTKGNDFRVNAPQEKQGVHHKHCGYDEARYRLPLHNRTDVRLAGR